MNGERHQQWKVVILGTGAVGGLYGAKLAVAGDDVTFLARSDYHALRTSGLHVETPEGNLVLKRPQVTRNPQQLPQADLVLVCWKATANAALEPALHACCGPHTCVLVLQNGWEIERDVAQVIGPDRVLGGCCFLCANRVAPGRIHHLDYGGITFGEYASSTRGTITERVQRIARHLHTAGIDAQPCADLHLARWKKLAWNIPFNGLSVVLKADTRQLISQPETRALAEALMREVQQCARSVSGVEVYDAHVAKMLADTEAMVPYASSMLLDYRHRRPMEVEPIFGNPLRAAIAAGYHPPRIDMLYQLLKFIDRRNQSGAAG
ncbi:MAG: 2-dehydropantoate 2-reductase [Pirellulaceae bacterium]|nr:MAG: 2-dehydropantoate 2-reductase [Pirellulaceae bacterium]